MDLFRMGERQVDAFFGRAKQEVVIALVVDFTLKPVSPGFVGNTGAVVVATAASVEGSCAGDFIAITVALGVPISLVDLLAVFVIFFIQSLCHGIVSRTRTEEEGDPGKLPPGLWHARDHWEGAC